MNNITLVGRVGGDVDIKYLDSGKAIAKLSLAVDRGKNKAGEKVTDWFTVKLFDKTAEVAAEYATKGKQIAVSGSMVNDKYEKDGQKRDYWQVNASRLQLLGGKEDEGGSKPASGSTKPKTSKPEADDE